MFLDERLILEGAVNLHLHVGPDYIPRYGDSVKLAQQAAEMGMRGLALKTHLASTVAHAYHANELVQGITCFGGITLNGPCGGLSPRTVEATLRSGGKMIWLPTTDAYFGGVTKSRQGHWIKSFSEGASFGYPIEFIRIIDGDGRLKTEVQDILRICMEHDAVLSSGHISPEECLALAKESKKLGYHKFKITHPNLWPEDFPIDVLQELVECGAVISLAYGSLVPHHNRQDPQELVSVINALGAEHIILVTDGGDTINPNHVQTLRSFYCLLRKYGVKETDLDLMMKKIPAQLVDLS